MARTYLTNRPTSSQSEGAQHDRPRAAALVRQPDVVGLSPFEVGLSCCEGGPVLMSEFQKAELFWLTEPSRGVFVINTRIGGYLTRFEITRNQLAGILVDGAAMALRPSVLDEGRDGASQRQQPEQSGSRCDGAEQVRRQP